METQLTFKPAYKPTKLNAHSGEFVHRFRSCRPVAEGSNAGGRIINQVDGMGSWNAPFIGFFLLKKEDG